MVLEPFSVRYSEYNCSHSLPHLTLSWANKICDEQETKSYHGFDDQRQHVMVLKHDLENVRVKQADVHALHLKPYVYITLY